MELKSLAAGILQIYDEANDVTPIYKFTPEQSNIVFHFTATIIKFIFCPDIQSNQSKGFVLNGKFLQAFGPTGEIRCDHNMIELSDSLPIIAINAKVFSIHPIFCLILTQENITEMLIMIEICDFEPIPTFPFLIDDEPPKTGNCTKKINLGKYTQFCCTTKQRIQKGKPLSLKIVGDPEKNASNRTLVFRKARAIDVTVMHLKHNGYHLKQSQFTFQKAVPQRSACEEKRIDWLGVADSAPIGQPNGFLAKVHFERILPPPRPPASTQALPKTNTANGFSINLWLLKCIICYFMSVG
ncbi:unnamed protein product, partial [Mesorhabditis belari]|uniref:Uncharacterized protein n=1 Tax=Mesorhabditis belari TaxID=2138241 RepID=A0AAF3F393_9BILA